ncbi:hypothetical protein HRbin22_00991 [Candidatus Thermoflexus japonica]|uniref:WD40 repeat domain-containing protein n=1 Tax=Candidatus Thermoflexus japonica TaxID=2035417 RepID=A0A2H5Y5M9_9CHLR|nr:hypothetical protein HRbin22_00991 [Candidatus Thermoflexus japonica]
MLRRRTRARSLIPIPVLALVLAIPSRNPLSSFWLAPEPDGWTLIFRPALASAVVAPQGEWIWLAFQRDGIIDALAVEGRSGRVRAHIRMGTPGCCLPPPLAMTPDGRWALVGGDAVWVYSPELGKRHLLRIEPSDTVIALAIAPDGQVAAGVTLKGRVLMFDPVQGVILRRWDPAPGRREVPGIAFAPDGRELWIAWNRRLEAWSLPALTARAIRPLPFDGTLVLTAIAPEGTWGLALGYRGEVLEGWILRREDLALQRIAPLGSLTLPRLRPIRGASRSTACGNPSPSRSGRIGGSARRSDGRTPGRWRGGSSKRSARNPKRGSLPAAS